MKKYIWILLALLLLAGCEGEAPAPTPTATPTPTPTTTPEPTPMPTPEPIGMEVDIGDGVHTFWVELVRTGNTGDLRVDIYREQGAPEPFQSFVEWSPDVELTELKVKDVDFDGDMDFYFKTLTTTNGNEYSAFYVWDGGTGQFTPDPYGLNGLVNLRFNTADREVISGAYWSSGGRTAYYQYENGALVEVGESFCPEENDTEKAYIVHWVTVDEEHTFWVEMVDKEPFGTLEIKIYRDREDLQPIQIFEDSRETQELVWSLEDMDFDGDMDLAVLYSMAPNGHASYNYYIWDAEEEKFIPDPYGLNELCSVGGPDMLPEEKAIRTFMRWGAGSAGEVRFYRYLEDGFTCVRQMFWNWHSDGEGADFLVENYENGELRTVYEATCSKEDLSGYLWSEEFSNWWELSYHGE